MARKTKAGGPKKPASPRKARPLSGKKPNIPLKAHGREAVMTLVSIMKEEDDPRVQIAAARALLSRGSSGITGDVQPEALCELNSHDIDDAIAVAKALLDELAARKAEGLSGPGELAAAKPSLPDNAAG